MRDALGHMVSFDVCGAADPASGAFFCPFNFKPPTKNNYQLLAPETALKHLDLSRVWISAACRHWFDAVPVCYMQSRVPRVNLSNVVQALLNQTLHPDEVDALLSS
jgi:hypothetical protein